MKKLVLILLGIFLVSCSTVKKSNTNDSEIKRGKGILFVKLNVQCPSEKIQYLNGIKGLSFNKSICIFFEKEFDSIGNTILWYMDWNRKGNEFYPISSLIKIYDKDKLVFERSMSFKTGPFITDEQEFKKSLYYRIGEIQPIFDVESLNDSISKIEVFMMIKE